MAILHKLFFFIIRPVKLLMTVHVDLILNIVWAESAETLYSVLCTAVDLTSNLVPRSETGSAGYGCRGVGYG